MENKIRCIEKLVRDMDCLVDYLNDDDITEIMLNSNSQVWVDSISTGAKKVGYLEPQPAQTIIYTIAGLNDCIISLQHPTLEAELPYMLGLKGERFTGVMPPVVPRPCFTIRKRSHRIFSLVDYVSTGRLSGERAAILYDWILTRKTILVAGAPGSGKTTVMNALIDAAFEVNPVERFIILEDVPELQCRGENKWPMLTTSFVSMRHLLITAMRASPTRILVGEVRGFEAYDMLKAWNTGCSGCMGTLHANGIEEAIQRLKDLSMEAGLHQPPISLISQTLDAIVFVTKQDSKSGFIKELALVVGYQDGRFNLQHF